MNMPRALILGLAAVAIGPMLALLTDDAASGSFVADTASATAYADTALTPDTAYSYRVVASNAGGASDPSLVLAIRTLPVTLVPINVTAAASGAATGRAPVRPAHAGRTGGARQGGRR